VLVAGAVIGSGLSDQWLQNLGSIAVVKSLSLFDSQAAIAAPSSLTMTIECSRLPSICRNLSVLYLQYAEFDKAVQSAQVALIGRPNDQLAHYWLGQAYWQSGKKEQARKVWRASGAIQARLDRLVWLASHHAQRGDLMLAEAAFREAIDLDPEYGPAYNGLASLMWGRDWEKVSWALQHAITYLPRGTAEWQWSVGRQYLLNGDWSNAVQALRASVKLQIAEWPMRFLADALARSGDEEGAAQVRTEIERRYSK